MSDRFAVLVTGVSPDSLGDAFLHYIAPYSPKLLILASRTLKNLEQCQAGLKEKYPDVPTKILRLDLSDLSQVRQASAEVVSWDDAPVIDVLCNNAGIAPKAAEKVMINGFESSFLTNHLGHFLFTKGVFPKVEKAARKNGAARIINISSRGHIVGPVRFDNYNFEVDQF
jgi:NAD(P)-dependent dehydrogenase (short-subunit alcohol dehydrogenase family)